MGYDPAADFWFALKSTSLHFLSIYFVDVAGLYPFQGSSIPLDLWSMHLADFGICSSILGPKGSLFCTQ